jgi:hypothetical protein
MMRPALDLLRGLRRVCGGLELGCLAAALLVALPLFATIRARAERTRDDAAALRILVDRIEALRPALAIDRTDRSRRAMERLLADWRRFGPRDAVLELVDSDGSVSGVELVVREPGVAR